MTDPDQPTNPSAPLASAADLGAFTRQWTSVLPNVAAFIGSMVHDVTDRDDVLQDAAVAAMTSFHRYDSARPFSAWAIGVARNQVRLYLRRRSNAPHFFDEEALDALVHSFAQLKKEDHQQLTHLESCVAQLDPKSRQLCELRYFQDLKPGAIANRLNQAPNTISKALQRIREQLRLCIEKKSAAPAGPIGSVGPQTSF